MGDPKDYIGIQGTHEKAVRLPKLTLGNATVKQPLSETRGIGNGRFVVIDHNARYDIDGRIKAILDALGETVEGPNEEEPAG